MTWYVDPDTGDVYDHEGEVVDQVELPGITLPDDVHAVMREAMTGSQPSAYNQALLADAATNNIERGMPPDQS